MGQDYAERRIPEILFNKSLFSLVFDYFKLAFLLLAKNKIRKRKYLSLSLRFFSLTLWTKSRALLPYLSLSSSTSTFSSSLMYVTSASSIFSFFSASSWSSMPEDDIGNEEAEEDKLERKAFLPSSGVVASFLTPVDSERPRGRGWLENESLFSVGLGFGLSRCRLRDVTARNSPTLMSVGGVIAGYGIGLRCIAGGVLYGGRWGCAPSK